MKPEFREGTEAKENFEQAMKSFFQAPKVTLRKKNKAETPSLRKKPRPDKN